MEFQINLTKMLDSLLKKKFIIIMVTIVAVVLSFYLVSDDYPDQYTAVATVYAVSEQSYAESLEGMRVIEDYVNLIYSYKVAESAAKLMDTEIMPEEIQAVVSGGMEDDSNIITIVIQSIDRELAVEIANATAEAFVDEANNITETDSVKMLDPARGAVLTQSGSSTTLMYRAIIVLGAFFGTILIVVLASIINTRVVYRNEVTLGGKIELLGVIPSKDRVK